MKEALRAGSSKQGNARLAFVDSNCVVASRLEIIELHFSHVFKNIYYLFIANIRATKLSTSDTKKTVQ